MPDKATPKPRQTPATWRVDGISREAVARAEQAAARAGAPLGVWLRRVIRETAGRGEYATGLLYVDPQKKDFCELLNLVDQPLATLPTTVTRPPRSVLDELMEQQR